MVENTEDQTFLSRWSQRKQREQTAELAEVSAQPAATVSVEAQRNIPAGNPAEQKEAEVQTNTQLQQTAVEQPPLTDADMPPVESLDSNSDYSPFLSEGVSKELRNMALKKLFFSGKFALRDGLDDYDDDFTRFEPLGNTVTSDMKFHQRRKERERLAKLEEEKRLEEAQQALEKSAHDEDELPADSATDESLPQEITDASEASGATLEVEVTDRQPDYPASPLEKQKTEEPLPDQQLQESRPRLTHSEPVQQSADGVLAGGKLKRTSTRRTTADAPDLGEPT